MYAYTCIQHLREADFPATPSPSSRGHYLGTRYVYAYLCIIACLCVRACVLEHACMHACMHTCTYACMYYMHVCAIGSGPKQSYHACINNSVHQGGRGRAAATPACRRPTA